MIVVLTRKYSAAIILFFVLLFRFVADLPNHPDTSAERKGKEFVDILIVAVTVIVVAIPGKSLLQSQRYNANIPFSRGSSIGSDACSRLCHYSHGQGEQPRPRSPGL